MAANTVNTFQFPSKDTLFQQTLRHFSGSISIGEKCRWKGNHEVHSLAGACNQSEVVLSTAGSKVKNEEMLVLYINISINFNS